VGDWQRAVSECDALVALKENSASDRMWARLQKAEFLWQTGHFEEADEVYGTLDPEKLPSKELLLRYFVGRARMVGQQKRITDMQQLLEGARIAVGEELCDREPLFLHARAGVMQDTGEQALGESIATHAADLAAQSGRWKDYVMIASRAGALALEAGKVRQAHRTGTRAISVATALGSDRMAAMAEIAVAFYEVPLGRLGSSMRRRRALLTRGEVVGDDALVTQCSRLGMYLGCRAGFSDLVIRAFEEMTAAEKLRQSGFTDDCLGLLDSGAGRWELAHDRFGSAVENYRHRGIADAEALSSVFLALACWRLNKPDLARTHFQHGAHFLQTGKYPFAQPIFRLIGWELGWEPPGGALQEVVESLAAEGRLMDLGMWGTELIHHSPEDQRLLTQKTVLAAITQIADSLESADLKREYLSFPRTKAALLAVRG
jgi:hypothetical protein